MMMRHLVCSLLVSLLLVPLSWSQTRAIKPVIIEATTAQDESISYIYEESHALIIGISDYTNGWSKLAGVKEDVTEVQRALENNGFEVQLLKDPDKQQLEATIEDFIFEKGANPENRLLIYYAGHGHTKTLGYGGEMGYLVPADAPLPKKGRDIAFQRSVMSMQRIEEVAKNTSAKHVLFMFDACFAGSVFLATRAAPSYIEVFTEEPVRQFITSGSADQEVPDISIFRRAFVDALAGSADFDKDGYLTGSELGTYIQKRTAEDWKGELTPQYGKLQDPNLNKGDFVFKIGKSVTQSSIASTATAISDLAAQAWSMIKNSENRAAFSAFIEKFPDAPQRQLAELKLILLAPSHSQNDKMSSVSGEGIFAKEDESLQQLKPQSKIVTLYLSMKDIRKSSDKKSWKTARISDQDTVYTGEVKDGVPNGLGTLIYPNGTKYVGEVRNGFSNGQGTYYYGNGAKYVGGTEDSETHAQDTLSTPSNPLSGETAKKKLFRDNECVGCDLNGTSLNGNILRGANLQKASLRGADLRGTDLHEAKLRKADLRGADLQRADLRGADLSNAEMRYADLNKANIKGASLINTKFCNTTMPDGSIANRDCYAAQADTNQRSEVLSGETAKKKLFRDNECFGCDLRDMDMRGTDLSKANLGEANLSEAYLYNANLSSCNLHNAKLIRTRLNRANLSEANLSEANLYVAKLNNSNLQGANLNEADLSGANFSYAILNGANLSNAKLFRAKLREADLYAANLSGANLNMADLRGARFCRTTMPDGSINNDDC